MKLVCVMGSYAFLFCCCRYTISKGKVTYMSNFIKSTDHKINHEKEKIVIARFGTPPIPDPCKNVFSR